MTKKPAKKKATKKPAKKPAPKKKSGAGRPKIEFDLEAIRDLASIGMTHEDIAIELGVAVSTITLHKKNSQDFSDAIKKGKVTHRRNILEAQDRLRSSGDKTMLIWLGKQHCGQRDQPEEKVDVYDGPQLRERKLKNGATVWVMEGVDVKEYME